MIKLFCDSAANLPTELIKKYSIKVVPFVYTVNGVQSNTFGDRFDSKAFYDSIRAGGLVKTSMINMTVFEMYFDKALAAGDDVLYVGLSSGISGTANAAKNAAAELREKYPERTIVTVDTLAAGLGEGLLVLEAAKQLESGADMDTAVAHVKEKMLHICQCFTVDDLKHLHRSGRLSGGAALIGGLLGIRPLLLGDNDGKIEMYDKVRGMKTAMDSLTKRWSEYVIDKSEIIAITHTDNEKFAAYLLDALRAAGFTGECIMQNHEPMSGSHLGPGAVALFFFGTSRM